MQSGQAQPLPLRRQLLAALILLAGLLALPRLEAREQASPLSNPADVNPAAMLFPYQQLLGLSAQSKGKAFALTSFTVLNNRGVDEDRPARLFLQPLEAEVPLELTSTSGDYQIDERYARFNATTNNPAKTCSFYLLLRARCIADKTGVNKAVLRQLFDDYKDFADAQLAVARKYYGAVKKDDFRGIRELITPDEIVIVFYSEQLARELAEQTSTRSEGRALRITQRRLDSLTSPRAKDPFAQIHADAIECVTPWRQLEPLPEIRDGAALVQLGWMSYRSAPNAPVRSELLTLALRNRK